MPEQESATWASGGQGNCLPPLGPDGAAAKPLAGSTRALAILEGIEDGVVAADAQGVVTYLNGAAGRLLGCCPAEALGRPLAAAFTEAGGWLSEQVRALRDTGQPFQGEWEGADGDLVLDWRLTPEFAAEGAVTGVLAVARDVSGARSRQAAERRALKMEALARLAGSVAHGFNNLLVPLMAYSDALLRGLPPADPMHRYAVEITRVGQRAASRARELLTFSRQQAIEPGVLDLNRALADLEPMLRRLLGAGIDLRLFPEPGLAPAVADPHQMEQAILNLVLNARDAMPHGGTLSLETAGLLFERETSCAYGRVRPGRYVALTLADTGVGMDRETLSRLFEPFLTTKEKGAGMGLAAVYGIVTQSGGYLDVTSHAGRGTTFRVLLPALDPLRESLSAVAAPALAWGGNERVLLVDDEEDVRAPLAEILRDQGYQVQDAASGEEALRLTRECGRVDLLITDVVMPGLSGQQLAQAMRAVRPGIGVIYISGYAQNGVTPCGVLDPGDEFLQKPFLPILLLRKARAVLDGARKVQGEG